MSEWLDGKTAPKSGKAILVYGKPSDTSMVEFLCPGAHTAAWDTIDGAFCLTGGTWEGPFIEPTHWMPLPAPPKTEDGE